MKYPFLSLCALALTAYGAPTEHDHANCSGHDHEHTHAEHEHAAHETHAHAEHDHEEHDHAGCSGHDHEHTHTEHKHTEHAENDHEEHDHSGCSGGHAHEHADHDAHAGCSGHDHAHGTSSGGEAVIVQVDARSRHILNMQVEEVPDTAAALTHSLYGYLSVPQHALRTYSLPCEGRITLHVKTAQKVQKGDLLYTLEAPDISDRISEMRNTEAGLARCTEETAVLTARVERLQAIGTRNGELEAQLRFKQAELGQLTRELQTARERLRMLAMGAEITEKNSVPILAVHAENAGTVRNVGITQGSWGERGAPIVTMSDAASLEIEAALYGSDVPEISEVRATLPQEHENITLKGTWRLAEQVDPERRTRSLYFTPENLPEGATAGKLCRLDLYGGHGQEGSVSIPDSAVIKVGVDDVVFVETQPGTYAMVKVQAGEGRRGMTPVRGLIPGQKIVVKGGYELKYILPGEGQKKKAGHFHADGKFHEGEDH